MGRWNSFRLWVTRCATKGFGVLLKFLLSSVFACWAPLVGNFVFAFTIFLTAPSPTFVLPPPLITNLSWIGIALVGAIASLFGFFKHYVGARNALMAVVAHGVIMVVVFAGLYRVNGLVNGITSMPPLLGHGTAIYFSVVTWTTLGYGDLRPTESMRLFAALQAALGYIFLGLIVGLATNLIARPGAESEND